MRVAVIGAFDRFNYGDVLFTSIARHVIGSALPGADLAFYGLRRSNMTALGGERTLPLSRLFRPASGRARPPDLIFVAGGDVLGARWSDLAGHFLPSGAEASYRSLRRRLGEARTSRLARTLLGCPHPLPFVIDPRDLPGAPPARVVYNAVGASQVSRSLSEEARRRLAETLRHAAWLSVRDDASRRILLEIGAPAAEVLPDSAVVMQDVFDPADLACRRRALLAGAGLPGEAAYICVQSADHLLADQAGALAQALRAAHRRLGLPVLAFTIGRVPDHNDQYAARRLAAALEGERWFRVMDERLAVADIAALISGAAAHLGTSLHGHITAFAFGRPRVGLSPRVSKLVGFRDSWDLPETPAGIAFGEAAAALETALGQDPGPMRAKADEAAAIYRAGAAAALRRFARPTGGDA